MRNFWRTLTPVGLAGALVAAMLAISPSVNAAVANNQYTWIPTEDIASSGASSTPNVRFDSAGVAYTVWTSGTKLKSATMANGSVSWTALPDIDAPNLTPQIPSLFVSTDDKVYASWREDISGGTAFVSELTGGAWSTPAVAGTNVRVATVPSVARSGTKVAVGWADADGNGVVKLSEDGATNWTATTLTFTKLVGGPTPVSLGTSTAGILFAAAGQSATLLSARLAVGATTWTNMTPASGAIYPLVSSQLYPTNDGGMTQISRSNAGGDAVGVRTWTPGSAGFAWVSGTIVQSAPVNPSVPKVIGAGVNPKTKTAYVSVYDGNNTNNTWSVAKPAGAMHAKWTILGVAAVGATGFTSMAVNPISGQPLTGWMTTGGAARAAQLFAIPGPPSPGAVPTITNTSSTSQTITWTSAQTMGNAISNYEVEIATAANGPYTPNPAGCAGLGDVLTCTATGLTSGIKYYYRVRAINSLGAGDYSATAGPTSIPGNPIAAMSSATTNGAAGKYGINLTGSVEPNGFDITSTGFQVSPTPDFSANVQNVSATPATVPSSTTVATPITGMIQDLTAATTYYARATATNTFGTTYSSNTVSVGIAGNVPVAVVTAATNLTSTSATLNGTVNSSAGGTAFGKFWWGTDPTLTTTIGSATYSPAPTGSTTTPVSANITGLSAGVTYYAKITSGNSLGNSLASNIVSFVAGDLTPVVTTTAATSITDTSATVNASIQPNGQTSTVAFQYSTDAELAGATTTAGNPASVSGAETTTSSKGLGGLTPGTKYYYRAVITPNGGAPLNGSIMSFTTPPGTPNPQTAAASDVTSSSATLNASVNPNGAVGNVKFIVGTNSGLSGETQTLAASPATTSGTSFTSVTGSATNLLPNTQYWFRVVVNNGVGGDVNGSILSFTTSPGTISATTTAATNVASTIATLNGVVNSAGNGDIATSFEWGLSSTLATYTTETAAPNPASGSVGTPISATIGFSPGQTYYFRAVAGTGGSAVRGEIMAVTTPASAPTSTTNAATGITGTAATLHGSVNAGGASTTTTFVYGTSPTLTSGTTTVTATQSPVTGSNVTAVSAPISGLALGATYYFRVVTTNSAGGPVNGSILSFDTSSAPSAPTAASAVAGDQQATVTFSAPASNGGSEITGYTVTASGSDKICIVPRPFTYPASCTVTGLTNAVATTFNITAANAIGTSVTATTAAVTPNGNPTATTQPATSTTPTGTTLNGSVIGNGATTNVSFTYGTSSTLAGGTTVTASPASVTAGSPTAVSSAITGLAPATTYYFRVNSSNVNGTSNGEIMELQTPPAPPTVTSDSANSITATTATLRGTVLANGATTTIGFEYSTDSTFTTSKLVDGTPASIGPTIAANPTAAISSLTPATTYYFRAIGNNGSGNAVNGSTLSFTTLSNNPVAATEDADEITGTTATLNGTVTAQGASTTTTFVYGTSPSLAGGNTTVTATQSPVTGTEPTAVDKGVTGLSLGTTYHYRVVATNSHGAATATAIKSFTTLDRPSVPTGVNALAGNQQATVAWTAPAADGGKPVNGYTVTASNGQVCTTSAELPDTPATTCIVAGLTNGAPVTFTVTATNEVGTSNASAASAAVTPAGTPSVTTNAASSVGSTAALLRGSVTANGATAANKFQYSTSSNMVSPTVVTATPATTDAAATASTSYEVTGLTPGTVYYFQALADNGTSTIGYGAVLSFITPAAVPTATTNAATAVTSTTATLNAAISANGLSTQTSFIFATNSALTLDKQTLAASPSTVTGQSIATTVDVTGLDPGKTYYYRANASNGKGGAAGAVMSFTTPLALPSAAVSGTKSVRGTTATVVGSVGSGGALTTVSFEYADNANFTNATTVPVADVVAGATNRRQLAISGLSLGTTYYFRINATNSVGPVTSDTGSFATLDVPAAPTSVTAMPADQTAQVTWTPPTDDGGAPITGYTVTSVPDGQTCNVGAPFEDPLQCTVRGLTNGTDYTFTVTATNENGTSTAGSSATAVSPYGAPIVTTISPSDITSTTAVLAGLANANGNDADVDFIWGTDPSLATGTTTTTAAESPVSGASSTPVTAAISGLTAATTYYYQVTSTNDAGGTTTAIASFITDPLAPTSTTDPATNIGLDSAQLNATVNPGGGDTDVTFRYWIDVPNPTVLTTPVTQISGSSPVQVSANVSLTAGTAYKFRITASNASGETSGSAVGFQTAGPPIVAGAAPTSVLGTSAVLNATVNANGLDSATGFFYSPNSDMSNETFIGTATVTGWDPTAISAAISGLQLGTQYWYQALGSNSAQTGVRSTKLSFTTQNTPGAPTSLTAVTFDGTIRPTWSPPATDGGSPVTSYTATAGGESCTVSTPFPDPLTCDIDGLTNGTEYEVSVTASNEYGAGSAATIDKTPAGAPRVAIDDATAVTATTATLNGSVNANGASSAVTFTYSTDPNLSADTHTAAASQSPVTGSTGTPVSAAITGLVPATTYYYRFTATNSAAASTTNIASFVTEAVAPTATTGDPIRIQSTVVDVAGTVNANGAETTVSFQFGTSATLASVLQTVTASPGIATGKAATAVTGSGLSLQPATTYYYRVVATNAIGTDLGTIKSFQTAGPPTVVTADAADVDSTQAELNGTVNPHVNQTQVMYTLGTDPQLDAGDEDTVIPNPGVISGSVGQSIPLTVTGLTPKTTYFYRAVGQNIDAVVEGSIKSFRTFGAPTVETSPATVSGTTGHFSATVNAEGESTTPTFEYSVNSDMSEATTVPGSPASLTGQTNATVTASVPGLTRGQKYYVRAIGVNSLGTTEGNIVEVTVSNTPTVPAVRLALVNVPRQVALNRKYRIYSNVSIASRQVKGAALPDPVLHSTRDLRGSAGVNGTSKIYINGVLRCTAKIRNGSGYCTVKIPRQGVLTFKGTFTGTVHGYTGSTASNATARTTANLVAIGAATMRVHVCTVDAWFSGMTTGSRMPVHLYTKSGNRWLVVGKTVSGRTGVWRIAFRTNARAMTVRVGVGKHLAAPIYVSTKKMYRAC